eukprot:jgi/Botrbrau1/17212/Bobra.0620s0002.1
MAPGRLQYHSRSDRCCHRVHRVQELVADQYSRAIAGPAYGEATLFLTSGFKQRNTIPNFCNSLMRFAVKYTPSPKATIPCNVPGLASREASGTQAGSTPSSLQTN